jgi:hypothetical protein
MRFRVQALSTIQLQRQRFQVELDAEQAALLAVRQN